VCGKPEQIICYPDDDALAICPICCESAEHHKEEFGHTFSYAQGEGWTCDYCGIDRNETDYEESDI
jgi:hypothetical protein